MLPCVCLIHQILGGGFSFILKSNERDLFRLNNTEVIITDVYELQKHRCCDSVSIC